MTFILSIDPAKCTGHGRCYTTSPDLLHDDEDGFVTLRGGAMVVPPDRLAEARQATGACPERAISLGRQRGADRADRKDSDDHLHRS
ncbi:ferredoxin [Streptomyces adelaidensis]|uniref:ferredoxin n=1 Tax=Streptomyces adelaidensis TaxID=2796465 RepID=UPI001907F249|nr:ferredoxin [Streptomyces adelaidensis]